MNGIAGNPECRQKRAGQASTNMIERLNEERGGGPKRQSLGGRPQGP